MKGWRNTQIHTTAILFNPEAALLLQFLTLSTNGGPELTVWIAMPMKSFSRESGE